MPSSPYRTPAPHDGHAGDVAAAHDRDLVLIFAILWLVGVGRLSIGLALGEPFGAELTLTAFALVALPLLAKGGVLALLQRQPDGERREEDP